MVAIGFRDADDFSDRWPGLLTWRS